MFRILLVVIVLFTAQTAYAELTLKPIHPDESVEHTLNQRFSLEYSLQNLEQINSSLDSFAKLTEISKNKISKKQLEKIGNTDWEIQNLGFTNWSKTIKGTLLKQEYLIKKLEYEIAKKRLKLGEINKPELIKSEKEYKRVEKAFQTFWNSFFIGD